MHNSWHKSLAKETLASLYSLILDFSSLETSKTRLCTLHLPLHAVVVFSVAVGPESKQYKGEPLKED